MTSSEPRRSRRWGRWALPVVITVAVLSQLVVGLTIALLDDGGELSHGTADLTVMANSQRQALQLQVAIEHLHDAPDLTGLDMRIGLLTKQTHVMLKSADRENDPAPLLLDIESDIEELIVVRDELAELPLSEWPAMIPRARELARMVDLNVKELYDLEERQTKASVAREVTAKRTSQLLLLGLSGVTLSLTGGVLLARWRRAKSNVEANEERFRSLVQNSSDLVLVLDGDGRVTYCSPARRLLLGPDVVLVGRELVDVVHPDDAAVLDSALRAAADERDETVAVGYRIRHTDKTWRHMESTIADLRAAPSVGGLVLNTRDVSDRTGLEARLRHQTFHDGLTGLANRALFLDRLHHAVARQRGGTLGVFMLDLDGFKAVNDSLGHATGDALLVDVTARFSSVMREGDTVARLGGDEFAVLVEDLETSDEVMAAATRLLHSLDQPILIAGRETMVTASIGVATSKDLGADSDADALLRDADFAMYEAKRGGKARVQRFDQAMLDTAVERTSVERELALSIQRDELVVHYQPIVELATGTISGFEALVRWAHPRRGLVGPDAFIPIAEDTGFIVPLGAHVLARAVAQAREWQAVTGRPVRISVNVSSQQLEDPSFPDVVRRVLGDVGLPPDTLTLEVTESGLVSSAHHGVEALRRLRQLGVHVAIDDFGTGYSSLAYLRELPVDELKLDKTFVDGFRAGGNAVVGEAVVGMCQTLGLALVAEGIEHADQAAALRRLRCERGQGFLFSCPVPASETWQLLGVGVGDSHPAAMSLISG